MRQYGVIICTKITTFGQKLSMQQKFNTPKEVFRATQVITSALMMGVVLMTGVIYFMVRKGQELDPNFSPYILYGVALMAGVGIVLGARLFRSKVLAVNTNNLMSKLEHYRAGLILKYALLEFPALAAVICYFLSGDWLFLMVVLFMLVIMFINRPTLDQVQTMLGLTQEEINQLA